MINAATNSIQEADHSSDKNLALGLKLKIALIYHYSRVKYTGNEDVFKLKTALENNIRAFSRCQLPRFFLNSEIWNAP